MTNLDRSMNYADYDHMVQTKFKEMHDNEQRWEEFMVDDADLVLVAYGISSRICKSAVRRARSQGLKLGLIRLISAWPYPEKAFKNLPASVKALVSDIQVCSEDTGNRGLLQTCTRRKRKGTGGLLIWLLS